MEEKCLGEKSPSNCTKMDICDFYYPEGKTCETCEDEKNNQDERPCNDCGSLRLHWRPKREVEIKK